MDLPDEDRDGAGRARLLADEIGAEAVVLLGAAFDKLAGRGKAGEFGGVARGLRRRRGDATKLAAISVGRIIRL